MLNFDLILGINNRCKEPYVLTLVSFLVYKEWLMLSLENKFRNNRIVLEYYKHELVLRLRYMNKVENIQLVNYMVIERKIVTCVFVRGCWCSMYYLLQCIVYVVNRLPIVISLWSIKINK